MKKLTFPPLRFLGVFVLLVSLGAALPLAAQRAERPTLDITGYVIDAELDTATHHIAAKAVVTFTPPQNAEEVSFGFHPALKVTKITDETGKHVGALEIQRNVTDEAVVQVKYQEMLEKEARERERLANQVRMRTKELLETNQLLLKTQKELLAYKKGLTV